MTIAAKPTSMYAAPGPGAIPPTAALLERLDADGFLVMERLCAASWTRSLLDISLRHARRVREALGDRNIGIGSAAGYVEIVQRSPGRWDVPIEPEQFGIDERQLPWWPLVTAVLSEDAEHSFSGLVYSEPHTPAQYWHCDSPHEAAQHRPAHAINVLLALHDIPLEMGPTECARGSHRLTNHLGNRALVTEELIYQHATTTPGTLVKGTPIAVPEGRASAMPIGSCLVFDDRLLHRGLANTTGATRYVAYFSYRRKGYATNTHFESQRSVFVA